MQPKLTRPKRGRRLRRKDRRPGTLQPAPTSSAVQQDAPAKGSREDTVAELEEMLRNVCGTKTPALAYALASQLGSLLVWNRPDPKRGGLDFLTTPAAFLAELSPKTGVEALLAVQMIGVHEAATAFLRRAQPDKGTGDEADKNVNRAVRLMRLFTEQLGAMAKLKGTASQQKVTVEHVHVHEGGQAIVGAVSATKEQPDEEGRGDGD